MNPVHVVGGGLAGSEAAWQLAGTGTAEEVARVEASHTGQYLRPYLSARLPAAVQPQTLALYAAPAINLFEKSADLIPLKPSQHEYHVVPDRSHVARAHKLGADLCVLAGTAVHARALQPAWRRHHAINSRRPTTTGARSGSFT